MPNIMDIFNQDAFQVISLTGSFNDMPYVPGRVGQMGLFTEVPVASTTLSFERIADTLSLLSPVPRGGPGQTSGKEKRDMRAINVPHFQHDDAIYADEVQGVREFGTADQVQTVLGRVQARMRSRRPWFDATLEYQRIGALKGVITYADASTTDLFAFFGVSQETEIDFDLDNANPTAGALYKKCAEVIRKTGENLGGLPYMGVNALCGDTFFDQLITHPQAEETFKYQQGAVLRDRQPWRTFDFGGITFENYRGGVGATAFVTATKCHFYPVGVPEFFMTYFAPADYIETVNTMGLPLYAKTVPMPNGKGVAIEMQSNPLSICTRPKALLVARNT